MRPKAAPIFGLVAALATTLAAGPATAQGMKAVLEEVIRSNPDIQVNKWEGAAAGERLRQARAGYLPTIDVALGKGREESDNSTTRAAGYNSLWLDREEVSLNLSQMIFDGFATSGAVDQRASLVRYRQAQLAQTTEVTVLRGVEVYLDVLRHQELVALGEENLKTHEKVLEQTRLSYEQGAGRKADVQQSESRLAQARSNLTQLQGKLKDAEARFARVVGAKPGHLEKAQSPADLLPTNEEEGLQRAVANNTALYAVEAQLAASKAAYKATSAAFMPRLDLEVGATDNQNIDGVAGRNADLSAMLRLRYNAYRGSADVARRQEAAYNISRAKQVIERTRRAVEENLRLSWNALMNARDRLADLRARVKSSIEVRDSYREQFTLGQRTLLDLLDSERELFDARTQLLTGVYTEAFGVYRVLGATSQLLDVEGLTPPTWEGGES
ncbi:TolC family outer membrane protein [Endothiovibrio diazotrophicus]